MEHIDVLTTGPRFTKRNYQNMGLVTSKMEQPTPKFGVPYPRFTNRSNLRCAACGVTLFLPPRNRVGNPQNGADYSILFRDP